MREQAMPCLLALSNMDKAIEGDWTTNYKIKIGVGESPYLGVVPCNFYMLDVLLDRVDRQHPVEQKFLFCWLLFLLGP